MSDACSPTWTGLLTQLLAGQDLSTADTCWAMNAIMSDDAGVAEVAGFLVALRAKGESVAEVRGLADMMLEHARPIEVRGETIDIVGTGGDRFGTVNISTMSAVVVAAAGVRVVKHGNRASSSKAGAADVLECLGVRLDLTPQQVADLAREVGITFCFAQTFHPSMRYAAPVRSALGVPTAFNMLGPLTNPAKPSYAAVGVADPRHVAVIAGVFADRGATAAVFRGDEGLDEMSIAGPSRLLWVRGGATTELTVEPASVGLAISALDDIRGGSARDNAAVARQVFAGDPGAARDAVLLNAGTALALATGAPDLPAAGIREAIEAGVAQAASVIDSGRAAATLARWVAASEAISRPNPS